MARAEIGRDRRAARVVLIEANALVALQDRFEAADLPVALTDRAGDAGDLVPAGLAPVDQPAEVAERLKKKLSM